MPEPKYNEDNGLKWESSQFYSLEKVVPHMDVTRTSFHFKIVNSLYFLKKDKHKNPLFQKISIVDYPWEPLLLGGVDEGVDGRSQGMGRRRDGKENWG